MKLLAILLSLAFIAFASDAQENVGDWAGVTSGPGGGVGSWQYPMAVLFDNGPFVTGPGQGSGGADISEMNSGESTYGFGFQIANDNAVADQFEVPAGETWNIESVTVFGYQTGSGTSPTINDIRLVVYDDAPTTGTVVFGDPTTNVLTSNEWTNCYRVNTGQATNTDRPIMANLCEFTGFTLGEGTYWMVIQAGGTAASGPWANPVTIAGQPATGDALQNTGSGWNPLAMGGTGAPIGIPFILDGTNTALSRSTWGEIKSLF